MIADISLSTTDVYLVIAGYVGCIVAVALAVMATRFIRRNNDELRSANRVLRNANRVLVEELSRRRRS